MNLKILLLDTETTGLEGPDLVQLAYKDMFTGEVHNELYSPDKDIEFGAMAMNTKERIT